MPDKSIETRQLAAIVFTDIVGFTKTMETNEQKAMEMVDKQRVIVTPIFAQFNGEILKEMGDGILIKFSSAIEAVRCAVVVQEEMKSENFTIKIGIHLGDVIIKKDDVYGSGVNIASRIHNLTHQGGICVSREIKAQIQNQQDIHIKPLGEKYLKGINDPVELFELVMEPQISNIHSDEQISFGKDLLNRRFPQFLGIYLAGSWAVVQFVDWLVNRYMLSPHLVDLSFVSIISLIPTVSILAYFHGRPGKDDWTRIEKIGIPINLFATLFLLFIMFSPRDLGAITKTVLVEDADGNQIERIIPKNEFRKKVAIFYFENETNDSTMNWLRFGLPWLCNADLEQDLYISHITQDYFDYKIENAGYNRNDKVPLSLKKKISKTLNKNYFLEGSFNIIDDTYIIKTKLYKTKNGNLITENNFVESNVFTLSDKVVKQLKIDLEIPLQYLERTTDLPVQSITTDNENALEYYIKGEQEWKDNHNDTAFEYFNYALDNDRYFLQAQRSLSILKMSHFQDSSWKAHWDEIILKSIDKLTDRTKFNYKMTYYSLTGDEVLYKKLALRQVKLYPSDIEAHDNLADVYYSENNPERFDNSMREYKIILQLDPERYEYYQEIGQLYHHMTQYDSSIYYYTRYNEAVPDDIWGYYSLAESYKQLGRMSDAVSALQNGIVLGNEEIEMKTQILWYKRSLNMDTSVEIINELNNMLAVSDNDDDSLHVYYNLAWIYESSGQLKASVDYRNIIRNLRELKYGLYNAIYPLVSHNTQLFIQAGLEDTLIKHLTYIENNAVSPDDNIIPYFYSKYYLYTENFDMLAATIDAAEDGYADL